MFERRSTHYALVPPIVVALWSATSPAGRQPDTAPGATFDQISLNFSSGSDTQIGQRDLPVLDTLTRGLTASVSGASAECVLVATSIRRGQVVSKSGSLSFSLQPGTSRLPPRAFKINLAFASFVKGDGVMTGYPIEHGIDGLDDSIAQIARSGEVFGKARVDWDRQSVLHLAVVPAAWRQGLGLPLLERPSAVESAVAAGSWSIVPIAFVMHGR